MKSRKKYQLEKFKKRYHYNEKTGKINIYGFEIYVVSTEFIPATKELREFNQETRSNLESVAVVSDPNLGFVISLPKIFFILLMKHWDMYLLHEIGHIRLNFFPVIPFYGHAIALVSPSRYMRVVNHIWRMCRHKYSLCDASLHEYQLIKSSMKLTWQTDSKLICAFDRYMGEIEKIFNHYARQFQKSSFKRYQLLHEIEADWYALMIIRHPRLVANARIVYRKTMMKMRGLSCNRLSYQHQCQVIMIYEMSMIPIPSLLAEYFKEYEMG